MNYKEAFEKLVWEMSDGLDNYDESCRVSYLWQKAKDLEKEVKSLLPNSCEQLKDKEETDFEEWKDDNFRYISNTMYERIKTIYFKDELLKIYENETANL